LYALAFEESPNTENTASQKAPPKRSIHSPDRRVTWIGAKRITPTSRLFVVDTAKHRWAHRKVPLQLSQDGSAGQINIDVSKTQYSHRYRNLSREKPTISTQ
jgi:hypothetical protein